MFNVFISKDIKESVSCLYFNDLAVFFAFCSDNVTLLALDDVGFNCLKIVVAESFSINSEHNKDQYNGFHFWFIFQGANK